MCSSDLAWQQASFRPERLPGFGAGERQAQMVPLAAAGPNDQAARLPIRAMGCSPWVALGLAKGPIGLLAQPGGLQIPART